MLVELVSGCRWNGCPDDHGIRSQSFGTNLTCVPATKDPPLWLNTPTYVVLNTTPHKEMSHYEVNPKYCAKPDALLALIAAICLGNRLAQEHWTEAPKMRKCFYTLWAG